MIAKKSDVDMRMKMFPAWLVIALVVGWGGGAAISALAATAPGVAEVPSVQSAKDLDTLIRELGDDDFKVRENASREIWRVGESALPALREASTSSDPELGFRARELMRKLQLHLTPDTDPSITALVERFAQASLSEKSALFAKLRAKRAWRQMLKLYAAESRAEVRDKLLPSVNGIAIKAARERLYQGDAREARELLELAPADPESLLALAEFHRSHGTLETELTRAREIKGRKSEMWQLALQRAAGNLDAARVAALAAGEPLIAAAMAGMAGDPLPWLREIPTKSADSPLADAYAAAAIKRWLGQPVRAADLAPVTRQLSARSSSERESAIDALFLLGEMDTAEEAYVEASPLEAFHYFESLERIPKALRTLGLDPDHPDYKAWVQKRLQKAPSEDIEDQHDVSTQIEELVAMANFLERRGLHEEAAAAYCEPMALFAAKSSEGFINLLGELLSTREPPGGAPILARKIGVAWAGDDEKRWDELVKAAFGEEEPVATWWSWLAEFNPKASRADRFEGMLALFGLDPDASHMREKWLALAWKEVDAAPAVERAVLAERISTLSLQVGDVATGIKAWDLLEDKNRKEVYWGEHILQLSAAERWNDAAKFFLRQIDLAKQGKMETSVHFHAYAAAALRQAGRLEEAASHDQWVNQLALGKASIALQVGNGYAFGRDYARATEWWTRAARQASPDSGEFAIALKYLSEVLMEEDKWHEAAAVSEMLARIYISSDYHGATPMPLLRQRLQADTAHALAILKSNRPLALATLAKCYQAFASDGSLADFFFPALRKAGLIKEHDAWFNESWTMMQKIIERYPRSANTRNTAAWFAARAMRKLDEAERLLTKALATSPNQAAFLDTMAEIQFAKGNRAKALEWSKTAVNFLPQDPQLRRQQERFRSEPLPK